MMHLFSHRQGYKPYEKLLQKDGIDEETRNRLWTILQWCLWDQWKTDQRYEPKAQAVEVLLDRLWFRFFKLPSDTRPPFHRGGYSGETCYDILRGHFFNKDWCYVYDFIEFVLAAIPDATAKELVAPINSVLEEENVAYRLAGMQFIPITNEEEIDTVTKAENNEIESVREHLRTAINFLSDRKNPDYRNSIKESISAVESLMMVVSGNKSATLSEGLKRIHEVVDLHPALKGGFEKLYGYTCDEDGIRHAIFSNRSISYGDAKYFLVSCSAFINYVVEKFSEHQAELKS
jgi:hypothetical protein